MRRRLAVATASTLTAVLALTGLAACGSGDDGSEGSDTSDTASASPGTGEVTMSDSIDGLTVTGAFAKEPKLVVDGLDVDAIEATVVIEGSGPKLAADGAAMASILLAKGSDGSTLQSSYTQDPFKMVVSEVHDAIRQAVTGQPIGSRVAIAAPASDLYGEQGATQLGVKATDDVILVIDLVKKAEPPAPTLDGPEGTEVDPPADAPVPVVEDGAVTGVDFANAPEQPPTDLQVIPLIEGKGAKVAVGDSVTVDYYGTLWGGDEAFDESFSGEPATFTLAEGSLIKGWVQGLEGVAVGSRVLLVIPPSLGYGDQEKSGIPANSTLVFVIDVLGADS